jgi:PAS domain S-box-containing protein
MIGTDWKVAVAAFQGTHLGGQPLKPEDWPLARSMNEGVIVNDEEIEIHLPNGKLGVISMSSTPVRDAQGKTVVAVATFIDITERRRDAERLRESEQRLHLLIESALDYAIFMLDLDNRIMSWNRGAERLLGWSEQEAIGRPGDLIFTPEDRVAGVPHQEMQSARTHGKAVDERVHLRKDGERFWASGMLMGVYNDKGVLCRYAKIIRDETARKAAENELQQALLEAERVRAAAESANRSKDEFISTISHELRTPLNTIRLWARMLGSERLPEPDRIEGVRMIDRSAEAQQHLIDDLLDVSRMSSGQLRLNLRATRLITAVRAAIESVQPSADARKVRIETQLDDSVGVVRADPDRIQQVVWNLVTNAVKFTPPGGRMSVRAWRQADQVVIEVRDTGIGIRADFLPHVFERFRQAEVVTTRRHGGLGLGLAIAKQLVELHGGTIEAQSEGEGLGATLTVYLPLPRSVDAADEQAPPIPGSPGLNRLRILLVEDDTGSRVGTCRSLELRGATVATAADSPAALAEYAKAPPEVMILDIGLPGEDGYSLLARIRAFEAEKKLPQAPAVALTAFARAQDRERAAQAGFEAHLPKPVDMDALTTTLQRVVRTEGK